MRPSLHLQSTANVYSVHSAATWTSGFFIFYFPPKSQFETFGIKAISQEVLGIEEENGEARLKILKLLEEILAR